MYIYIMENRKIKIFRRIIWITEGINKVNETGFMWSVLYMEEYRMTDWMTVRLDSRNILRGIT